MSRINAIILAGGTGSRMGHATPKQLLTIEGKPVLAITTEKFQAVPEVDEIIIVSNERYISEIELLIRKYDFTKVSAVTLGGDSRQGSVYRSLCCRGFMQDEILLLHDAARPFISEEVISRCIACAQRRGAAGVYVPAIDTIAEIDSEQVQKILRREKLYYTQTPQCFRYSIIREAHERAIALGIDNATDDVSLVIDAGYPVSIVQGDYSNIKITTHNDLAMAGHIQAFLNKS